MNEEDYVSTPHSDGDYDIYAPPYQKPLEGYNEEEFGTYSKEVREAYSELGGADDQQNSPNQS